MRYALQFIGLLLLSLACNEPNLPASTKASKEWVMDSIDRHFEDNPAAAKTVVAALLSDHDAVASDPEFRCRCQARLAVIHEQLGEIDPALKLYDRMLEQCEHDPKVIVKGLNNRASLLIKTGDYELARVSLNHAHELAGQNGLVAEQRSILQTKSAMFHGMGACDSVVAIADLAYDMAVKSSDSSGAAKALITKAACYNDLGELTESRTALQEAIRWSNRSTDVFNMIYIYVNLGVVMEEMGELDSAAHYYQLTQVLADSIGEWNMEVHAEKNLAYLDYDRGEFQRAFDRLENAQFTEDSIFSMETKDRIADLEMRYHTKEQEATIQILEQENQIGALQRNFFIVLTFLFLAVATAAILIYSNRIRSQKMMAAQKIAQLEKEKEVMSLQSMLFAQEEERQRIARDLHDSIGALLSAAKLHLSNIEDEVRKLAELDFLSSTEEAIDRASSEVRRVAHDMMPGVLMRLGLTEGIEDFFERLRRYSDITISFTHDTFEHRLPNKHEVMIYRIVQELANNTIKHAEASEIKLMIKRDQQQIVLDYRDDGKGFDIAMLDDEHHFGLSSLKSRVRFLQGDLEVESAPGEGVHFNIRLPDPGVGG